MTATVTKKNEETLPPRDDSRYDKMSAIVCFL